MHHFNHLGLRYIHRNMKTPPPSISRCHHLPKEKLWTPEMALSCSSLQPRALLSFLLWGLTVPRSQRIRLKLWLDSYAGFVSLSIKLWRFTHVTVGGKISFLLWLTNIPSCDFITSYPSLHRGYLGYFFIWLLCIKMFDHYYYYFIIIAKPSLSFRLVPDYSFFAWQSITRCFRAFCFSIPHSLPTHYGEHLPKVYSLLRPDAPVSLHPSHAIYILTTLKQTQQRLHCLLHPHSSPLIHCFYHLESWTWPHLNLLKNPCLHVFTLAVQLDKDREVSV